MEPRPRRRTLQTVAVLLILALALWAAYFILRYEPGDAPQQAELAPGEAAAVRLASWNIANLGGSKDDQEIAAMARTLRDFDLVAVQEVITSPPGAQAVARLDDALDRTGAGWDYVLSEPTTGRGSERYAFLWKPAQVRLVGQPWLEASVAEELDREPYLARFERGGRRLLLVSFHAVPSGKNPAGENRLLERIHHLYPDDHVVIAGDFNLPQDDDAFDGLRVSGYRAALLAQRTTLRMERRADGHLANAYDNIFYETAPLRVLGAGVVDFSEAFPSLQRARDVSDHLPVYAVVGWN